MVGLQVLVRLLDRHVPVAVLVRDSVAKAGGRVISAADRIDSLIGKFESHWDRSLQRPVVLNGDINRPGLGLSPDATQWIATNCSSVLHSAACLSFRPASETTNNEPYQTNFHGTRKLLAVCKQSGIEDFHYVSTAYVSGLRDGLVSEADLDCGQRFANDYERSKVQAEQLLHSDPTLRSLTIYRPSIVIDSTGLSPVPEDRTVYGAFTMFHTLASKFGLPERGEWFRNLGAEGGERKNLVEASWVAEMITEIFLAPQLHGRTYHLTDPTGLAMDQLEKAFFEVTEEMLQSRRVADSTRRQVVPLPSAAPIPSGALNSQSKAGRKAILDAIAAPFVEMFLPYIRNDPTFGRDNTDHAVDVLSLDPPLDVDATRIADMIRLRESMLSIPVTAVDLPIDNRLPSRKLFSATHKGCLDALSPNGAEEPSKACDRGVDGNCGVDGREAIDEWGLILSGRGGGDYRMDTSSELGFGLGGETCTRRIYLSCEDFDAIVADKRDFLELVEQGRLVVENDDEVFKLSKESLIVVFGKLTQCFCTQSDAPEATSYPTTRLGSEW